MNRESQRKGQDKDKVGELGRKSFDSYHSCTQFMCFMLIEEASHSFIHSVTFPPVIG